MIEINCPKTIIEMVIEGGFASFFYESEIQEEIKSGKLIPIEIIEIKNSIDFYLIYYKNHLSSKKINSIAEEFIKLYNEFNYLKYTSS